MKGSSCKHDIYKCTRIQTIKFWGKISNQVIKIKKKLIGGEQLGGDPLKTHYMNV